MTRTSKELLVLALALGFAACNKANPPGTPSVAFVSPVDGAMLTADAGTVSNGLLTFQVTASVNNAPAGSMVELKAGTVNGNTAAAPASGSGEVTLSITLSGGNPATSYMLELELEAAAGIQVATATINISVLLQSTGACSITISPPNGSLFNESGIAVQGHNTVQDEDLTTAGMQAKVTVSVGPPCADGMSVTLVAGTNAPLTATLAGGLATFDETPLPDTPVTALQNTTQLLGITASVAAEASSATISYIVDSQMPTISITSPVDGATLPAGSTIDVMGFTDIHQLPGTPVPVFLSDNGDAGVSVMLVPAGDGGFTEPPLTAPTGANALVVSVTGVTGNQAISSSPIVTILPSGANCTDAGAPTVMFASPTPDAGFNLAVDEDGLQPGFQTPLRITTSSMAGLVEFCSTVPPTAVGATPCPFNPNLFEIGNPVPGPVTVSGGRATLDAATLGDDGAALNQTLTAQVTDGTCGTQGEGSVTIEVHAVQPVIDSAVVENAFGLPDGGCVWLNATNLKNGAAQTTVLVTVDGSDTFGDGGPVLMITGTIDQTDSASLDGGATPAAEVPISLPNGAYTVSATITDIWGNQSAADQFQICVKTTLPTCTLSDNYSNGCFNIQDDVDGGASSGAVPVMLTVTAANASATGVNGNTVDGTASVSVNSVVGASDPIANVVSVSVSSTQGADAYSATVTDPAGNPAATCAPASLDLTVSTVAPAFVVTPQSGSGLDDAGCEIYSTRDGVVVDVATTDISNGTGITVVATGPSGGSTAKTSATVTNSAAAATLSSLPNGIDTVTASGTDSCGNLGTGSACIDVQATGCDLSLVSPVATETDAGESLVFNAGQVSDGGIAGIEFHTGCAAGTQVQFDSTASGGNAQPQDGGVDANGDVTFDLTSLIDGSSGTLTADISGGESLPTISYDAKLSLPAFTGEIPTAGNLEIVANQDNLILDDAGVTPLAVDGGTIMANEAQCTTTACADFTISGISGLGPVDGSGNIGTASLALNFGGGTTNPNPITIANGTTSVTFSGVNMPAVATGTVTLTLTDNVGNTITETWNVTTDSLQPAAPSLTAAMSDKRAASVNLSWTVPATGGDSATQGYELAYVVNNLNPATVPTTPTEATYATWTLDPTIAGVGVNSPVGTMLTHIVSPPFATLNQYTFELRAIDAVGNRSPLTTDAIAFSVLSTDSNAWQTLTITENDGNGANSDFGYVLRTGDFNGDGMQDLVITAPYQFASNPTPGIVYIMNGATAANLANVTFAGLASITLGGTDYDYFGQDAHVADYNGDTVDDLVVGAPYYNSGQGRIDIFFGNKPNGLPATPNVTIFGDPTQTGYFGFSVSSADVNGDGIPDLLVGAPGMGSGSGSVYVFLSSKNWPASAASPDAGPISPSPTSIISGNAGDGLGAHSGTVPIGDINADGDGDFAVGAPGGGGTDGLDAGSGTEYGISGASVLANASISVSSGALFTLIGRNPGYCAWGYNSVTPDVGGEPLWECYGVGAIGELNTSACNGAANCSFTGGKLPDLVVSSAYYSSVSLYTMTKTGPTAPAAFGDDEGYGLGWTMVASDLNTDGHPDLLVGPNDTTTGVYLYLNTGTGLTTQPQLGGVQGEPFSGEIPSPADGSYFGYGVTAGDYQGIGKQDFAVSDAYPNPYVNVYY